MSESVITFCDLCNVNQNYKLRTDPTIEADVIVDEADPDVILCNGPGYIFTEARLAVENLGWRETDYGHQCPVCAAEEDDQNALDEATDAESGATLEPTLLVDAVEPNLDPEGLAGERRTPQPPKPEKKKTRRAKK